MTGHLRNKNNILINTTLESSRDDATASKRRRVTGIPPDDRSFANKGKILINIMLESTNSQFLEDAGRPCRQCKKKKGPMLAFVD